MNILELHNLLSVWNLERENLVLFFLSLPSLCQQSQQLQLFNKVAGGLGVLKWEVCKKQYTHMNRCVYTLMMLLLL